MWGIKDLFWADRFFRWWKNLWKNIWNKIAPFEQKDDQELPSIECLAQIHMASTVIDSFDPLHGNLARTKSWGRRFRINPRKGWWRAMNRRQLGAYYHVG